MPFAHRALKYFAFSSSSPCEGFSRGARRHEGRWRWRRKRGKILGPTTRRVVGEEGEEGRKRGGTPGREGEMWAGHQRTGPGAVGLVLTQFNITLCCIGVQSQWAPSRWCAPLLGMQRRGNRVRTIECTGMLYANAASVAKEAGT